MKKKPQLKKKRDLLTPLDFSPEEVKSLLLRAKKLKQERKKGRLSQTLKGKTLAMIFEKPSTRTKMSFDVAMYELGGHSVELNSQSSQLGRGESYEDTGRVLSRYAHGILIRTFAQESLERLAEFSSIPVINGLSDLHHPCQIFTDLFTIQEFKGDLMKQKIAYVGDGNNMVNSWIEAAIVLGFQLKIGCPRGYGPDNTVLMKVREHRARNVSIVSDPWEAMKDADVVNTDTWFSMGQEVSEEKRQLFAPYQVNESLLKRAKKDAIVLHCLPAHRGEEIASDVMDGAQSRVWDQAENRLHVQKAILELLMKGK